MRKVVVTGGPGAGKTALLETVRRHFCEHVVVLPEAASILYGGGFPRNPDAATQRAAQRAIYHVQRELEEIAEAHADTHLVLCDRGTLDGIAYWPEGPDTWFRDLGTSLEAEYARYYAVIHLRTPAKRNGYNHQNPLRIESANQAAAIDQRIAEIWSKHPRRLVIEAQDEFIQKVKRAIELIRELAPNCVHLRAEASP